MNIDRFLKSYAYTALWSSCDDEWKQLDADYDIKDISDKTMAKFKEDCEAFVSAHPDGSDRLIEEFFDSLDDDESECAGANFWLSRNGHGAGFFDGEFDSYNYLISGISMKLQERARIYNSVDLYVGDDGKIHA